MQRMYEFSFVFADGKTFRIAVGEPIKLNPQTLYVMSDKETVTITHKPIEGVVAEIQYKDGEWHVKLEDREEVYVVSIYTFEENLMPRTEES